MEVTVKLNYLRIAPRKVGQVANLVRGKKADEAEAMLSFLVNRPAKSVLKLLRSATAAAKHDFQLDSANLYISKIFVNEGPKLKRWNPVSRGSAHPLWKRVSHITLSLDEIKPIPISSRTHDRIGAAKKTVQEKKETPAEPAKIETTEKTTAKETNLSKRKEKPKFGRKERKSQKNQGAFNRIFRRKVI